MRPRSLISWALMCAIVLLFGTLPAQSGVHLWRITEIFSNADGTVQFIEMTTCCGSTGGEIFLNNAQLTRASNPAMPFTFNRNLDNTTLPNKHVLLGTAGYKLISGAPPVDFTIPDNFVSLNGDTLTFSAYDVMTVGPLPTNGRTSLNKNEEDSTDTVSPRDNSPTNLHEQTGMINVVSGPPGVPDGTGGSTPLRASSLTLDGSQLRLTYDPTSCANGANHHLLYGQRSGLPAFPGGTFTLMGSVCNIGNTSPYDWVGSPPPDDGRNLIWFLITATDASGVEGSWGVDGAGNERVGPGSGGASAVCATIKNVANACGHTP